ncbi:transcription repressor OFP14-like [Arachis stenosperma]|uniref:transcription repressor OFP14-like n=1 Tax=Arachis stenosperma TaxID=217475 RepID=UPI0025ACA5E7|nr:transcription repressor OFP14-like [Arachis stenosperma]
MPKKIKKSLKHYISKIKNTSHPQIHLVPSKKWVLSSCKHPRTPSFALENKKKDTNKDDEATLADVDRFLFENFKSLYLKDDDEEATTATITATTTATKNKECNKSKKVAEEKNYDDEQKGIKVGSSPIFYDDIIDLRGSNRFFMPRALSESYSFRNTTLRGDDDEIISNSTSVSTHNNSSPSSQLYHSAKTYVQGHNHHDRDYSDRDHRLVDNCVAVLASSESPYEDFKNSMQGMVDARVRNNQRVDWDFMEELLFCHINLNDKKLHKFILSAFVELVTALRQQPENNPPATAGKPRSVRTVRSGNLDGR